MGVKNFSILRDKFLETAACWEGKQKKKPPETGERRVGGMRTWVTRNSLFLLGAKRFLRWVSSYPSYEAALQNAFALSQEAGDLIEGNLASAGEKLIGGGMMKPRGGTPEKGRSREREVAPHAPRKYIRAVEQSPPLVQLKKEGTSMLKLEPEFDPALWQEPILPPKKGQQEYGCHPSVYALWGAYQDWPTGD